MCTAQGSWDLARNSLWWPWETGCSCTSQYMTWRISGVVKFCIFLLYVIGYVFLDFVEMYGGTTAFSLLSCMLKIFSYSSARYDWQGLRNGEHLCLHGRFKVREHLLNCWYSTDRLNCLRSQNRPYTIPSCSHPEKDQQYPDWESVALVSGSGREKPLPPRWRNV
jgi:hypothetical protein